MEALGGDAFRRARTEVVDAQIASEQAAMDEEINELKAEAARATGDAKARLQKQIDAAKGRLQGLQSREETAHESDRQQLEAKLRVIQDRAAKAKRRREGRLPAAERQGAQGLGAQREMGEGTPPSGR